MKAQPLGRAYRPWVIGSVVVLVGSLGLLGTAVVAAFANFGQDTTPLWLVLLGAVAVLRIATGFRGLVGVATWAGWRAWREGRRVQVLPPERDAAD